MLGTAVAAVAVADASLGRYSPSSSEFPVTKRDSSFDIGLLISDSSDSSISPVFRASRIDKPLITADRVRPCRLNSTLLYESNCFGRPDDGQKSVLPRTDVRSKKGVPSARCATVNP